ncbi:hypothetical protein LY76DRAFT_145717 [Colletotrichum caudatum]|nr:hypothetical protein LY76DRAFT_145717 [Colletotrichum caudatum]
MYLSTQCSVGFKFNVVCVDCIHVCSLCIHCWYARMLRVFLHIYIQSAMLGTRCRPALRQLWASKDRKRVGK